MSYTTKVDIALDAVLKASGSALRHYTMPKTLEAMREAMGAIMSDAYIDGMKGACDAAGITITRLEGETNG